MKTENSNTLPPTLSDADKKDICVLLPVLNEEAAIGPVVRAFVDMGYPNILVMDGNSKDKTREAAQAAGARVVVQSGKGKGQAMIEAFSLIEEKYIVMLDGDGTNPPSEAALVLEPVLSGKADHVIGNRIEKRQPGAFTTLNLVGNRLINRFYRFAFRSPVRDTLTGYHAFTTESVRDLNLTENGFVIETEMIAKCHMKSQRVSEVATTYYPREIEVQTKLHPIRDGGRIILAVYRYSRLYNPFFFFALPGLAALFLGLLSAVLWAASLRIPEIPQMLFPHLSGMFLAAAFLLFLTGAAKDIDAALYRETYRDGRRGKK